MQQRIVQGTIFAQSRYLLMRRGINPISYFGSLIAMTFRARLLADECRLLADEHGPRSRICVHPGHRYELTFQVTDCGEPVDWSGHHPRFRVYSQTVDRLVVLEITDPLQCGFESDGIWRLCLTGEETESLPRGGMRFTLEHGNPGCEEYQLAVIGGVSCTELRADNSHAIANPHYQH